jgi:8-oxo-dGTP pyrophosphatase MutT (NUDIX family)
MSRTFTELVRLSLEVERLVTAAEWDSAAVLIIDDKGRGLILQRGASAPWMPNRWNLPGGTRDPGEDSSKAVAIRECEEELGVRPKDIHYYGAVKGRDYLLHLYVAYGYTGTIKLNRDENTDMKWVYLEELDGYQFIPGLEGPIAEALSAAA